ncbi:MAG: class D beta-lactamase [Oscillatoriophycideae cyanobacterium NC_groundwater_1537_Pr4_S-0.65um_50_18]|nr:class D beta-lactamase [Oscillatoriophycideae cyanobacterium NC_groundwater_1537_Pr4_S-0.65um_50_18]
MRLPKFIKSFWFSRGAIALLLICSLVSLSARSALSGSPGLQIASTQSAPAAEIAQTPNFEQAFQELGIDGAIVIYDKNNQRFYEHNPSRNTTAFFPASTFKVLNALISLETGVIRDDVSVLTWDGITREIPAWNRDTNLRQAFKDSTVWFYQVLARRNGHERMQQFVEQVGYGNQQIGTPDQIDHFWLDGPLQITPKQEIEFLQRLEQNDLPFSQRTIDLVKDIMIIEKTPDYTLRGKTGWINSVNPNVGWIVGYLEQNNNVYFFATNIVIRNSQDAAKRLEVTRQSFQALGLL